MSETPEVLTGQVLVPKQPERKPCSHCSQCQKGLCSLACPVCHPPTTEAY